MEDELKVRQMLKSNAAKLREIPTAGLGELLDAFSLENRPDDWRPRWAYLINNPADEFGNRSLRGSFAFRMSLGLKTRPLGSLPVFKWVESAGPPANINGTLFPTIQRVRLDWRAVAGVVSEILARQLGNLVSSGPREFRTGRARQEADRLAASDSFQCVRQWADAIALIATTFGWLKTQPEARHTAQQEIARLREAINLTLADGDLNHLRLAISYAKNDH